MAPLGQPQHRTQALHHRFQYTGIQPALTSLAHRIPRWPIMRHQAPGRAPSDDPAQSIKCFAQAMCTLRGLGRYEGQIGGDKGPRVITDITELCWPCHRTGLTRRSR
jgi:hypothetical protein